MPMIQRQFVGIDWCVINSKPEGLECYSYSSDFQPEKQAPVRSRLATVPKASLLIASEQSFRNALSADHIIPDFSSGKPPSILF